MQAVLSRSFQKPRQCHGELTARDRPIPAKRAVEIALHHSRTRRNQYCAKRSLASCYIPEIRPTEIQLQRHCPPTHQSSHENDETRAYFIQLNDHVQCYTEVWAKPAMPSPTTCLEERPY